MPELSRNNIGSLVTISILIDGNVISSKFGIISITTLKEVNKIPYAKVLLHDGNVALGEFSASNSDIFIPGKEIEIQAGYNSNNFTIFNGIIIKQGVKLKPNGDSFLIIDCKDEAVKMSIGRKSKYYYESSDSDVIEELISSYGLEGEVESTDMQHEEIVQYRSTDWDFMLTRSEVNGKFCLTDDGKITITTPDLSQNPIIELAYGHNLLSFDFEMDARNQFSNIKTTAWDFAGQEMIEVEAIDPNIDEAGNLSSNDLAETIGLDELILSHGGRANETELQSWADAKMLRQRLARIQGRITINGLDKIKPGDLVELKGVSDRYNGKLFVSAVRHQISAGEWLTDLQIGFNPEWFTEIYNINQPKASGLFPAISGLQIGIVTQLEGDPDGEDRIQVKLPIVDASEVGIWARRATIDAGSERGSFFLPEIGDEVIVGFINDDPTEAVVLGSLYSSAHPSPLEVKDDNFEKGFITKTNMKILMDDDKESITISNDQGNKVEVQKSAITLTDSHGNKITMNGDGIKIESIKDIEIVATNDLIIEAGNNTELSSGADVAVNAGANCEVTASVDLIASGGATAALEGGAQTVVKGGIVMIN